MPTTIGCRKFFSCSLKEAFQLTESRKFFPHVGSSQPAEDEEEGDWEKIEAGDSAENGPSQDSAHE